MINRSRNEFIKAQSVGWILALIGYAFLENKEPITSLTIFAIATYYFCVSIFHQNKYRRETESIELESLGKIRCERMSD